jgi:SAM-dependent methyltransferase
VVAADAATANPREGCFGNQKSGPRLAQGRFSYVGSSASDRLAEYCGYSVIEASLLCLALSFFFLSHASMVSWFVLGFITLLCLPGLRLAHSENPPFLPSSKSVTNAMLRAADIQPGHAVFDLGCGDGRLVCAAADRGARATGYEISLVMFFIAKIRCSFHRGAMVRYLDFWKQNFRQADALFCYLLPDAMARVEREIWPTLKPGCLVISHSFPMRHTPLLRSEGGVFIYRK